MRRLTGWLLLVVLCTMLGKARGQAKPAAMQPYRLSVFAGWTGTASDVTDGLQPSITAGLDVGLRPFGFLWPSVEVRGTYPARRHNTVTETNGMGGVKIAVPFGRLQPYGDVLYGRGAIGFVEGYTTADGGTYTGWNGTNVLSPGGGVDYQFSPHLALRLDAQYQRYSLFFGTGEPLVTRPVTIGVVYHFSASGRTRYPRR